jgi:hypothetical protein
MLLSLCAVCASTGVGAASSSSKGSVQATPSLVGSPVAAGTSPAACMLNGSASMYVFVKGYDGALWYRIVNTTTDNWATNWTSLGGRLASSPAAVSPTAGYMDVWVAGTDGAVWVTGFHTGAAWYAWLNVGGKVYPGTGPAVSGWPGREDCFVRGTDGAMWQLTDQSGSLSSWASLGGKLTSSPAATARGTNWINTFVRGTDGAIWETSWYNGAWHPWITLGGGVAPGTGPAACTYGTGREDLFVQGTNGALWQRTWTGSLSGWTSLGGKLTSSPAAATTTYEGYMTMYVFVRGTNGLLYAREYFDGGWTGWVGPYQGP